VFNTARVVLLPLTGGRVPPDSRPGATVIPARTFSWWLVSWDAFLEQRFFTGEKYHVASDYDAYLTDRAHEN
jgi:hypothetical protein